MYFGFETLKIRDRIQTIPFKIIPKASRDPQYSRNLIEDVLFFIFRRPGIDRRERGGGGGGGGGNPRFITLQY